MGQYWKLVNIDKERELRHVGGLKLWEFVTSKSAEQLVGLLRTSDWLKFKIPSEMVTASKQKSSSSSLLRLPQELIDNIVSHLVDLRDRSALVHLSLTCAYFFRLLAPLVQDMLLEDSGPWSGDRLIFVGDYAEGYPDGIATSEEKTEWAKFGRNPLYVIPRAVSAEGKNLQRAFFGRRGEKFEHWGELLESIREGLDGGESLQLFERLVKLLKQAPNGSTQASLAPVLRNLTIKEYVRDAVLAESEYAYSLGEVVVVHTQWTDDGSGLEGLSAMGEWAGHRLDISDMAHVAGEEWKDVSERAVGILGMVTDHQKKDGRRA
ncbi:hypothetical protein AK830_g1520 [Neonectria ditissima]|uniref:F-box domain-containing protein n=1 Tax=Neonectria ditissima TaxID=78410 RepID=A0A0P7BYW7_9HYPO|nr:hypothetical protein AK830_g1520 [Neonectria ditissima]